MDAPEKNIAFFAWAKIRESLKSMKGYLVELEKEFRANYKEISELQRAAEQDRKQQIKVWEKIRTLDMIRDLLGPNEGLADHTRFTVEFLSQYQNAVSLMKWAVAERQNLLGEGKSWAMTGERPTGEEGRA